MLLVTGVEKVRAGVANRCQNNGVTGDSQQCLIPGCPGLHIPSTRNVARLVLTASRTGEVLTTEWTEFDIQQKAQIMPAERKRRNACIGCRAEQLTGGDLFDKRCKLMVARGAHVEDSENYAANKRTDLSPLHEKG